MNDKEVIIQNKANNLKTLLFSDNIKNQLAMAIPKWLSIDRLLRVVFSSILKNPKLLDCTQESILNSVMQCAQLGLEPILGKAHLIPYTNKKKQGNPLECQFQPGYQGLIDLAQRTGNIESIRAHCIYEHDEYKIQYGYDEKIDHVPVLHNQGKMIGVYTVWTKRPGIKTFTFMTIEEIEKIRDKSIAYQYAIKVNSKDTPWITDFEEMAKKTVIKRHSKLEPASIEFMTAVEIDNEVETGAIANKTDYNGFLIDMAETQPKAVKVDFYEMIPSFYSVSDVDAFLQASANLSGMSIDDLKDRACENEEAMKDFLSALKTWKDKQERAKEDHTQPPAKLKDYQQKVRDASKFIDMNKVVKALKLTTLYEAVKNQKWEILNEHECNVLCTKSSYMKDAETSKK